MTNSAPDTGEHGIKEIQTLAESGDAEAQYRLGLAYYEGKGVAVDEKLAALWLKRAAQQNHPQGTFKFSDCLYYGVGIPKNLAKAFEFALVAAKLGNVDGMNSVAYAYQHGEGTDADPVLSTFWYRQAAERGQPDAQNSLGTAYECGRGVEVNEAEATLWYRKSAEQNNIYGLYNLGVQYLKDENGEADPLEAVYWLKKSAELGHASAQYKLGSMLYFGSQIAKNSAESVYWLRKAAVQQYTLAYDLLADELLAEACRDVEESFYWALLAAADKQAFGMSTLAGAYYAVQNDQMAAFWYRRAADLDDEFSIERVKELQAAGFTELTARDALILHGIDPDAVENATVVPLRQEVIQAVAWGDLPVPTSVRRELGEEINEAAQQPGAPDTSDGVVTQPQSNKGRHEGEPAAAVRGEELTHTVVGEQLEAQHQRQFRSPSSAQLPPGSILAEKYLIQSVVGKGGMAVVFKARHLLMERTVAIKMLLPEIAKDETTVKRFQREAMAACALRHPNIITIYDFGVSDENQPYIVMDFLQGQSLEAVLEQEQKLSPSRTIPILIQVCDALSVAHQSGIIHRDVKPSNIMLEDTLAQKDFARLVDFGIAKNMADQDTQQQKLTKTGEVFGSLVYMSPEQCLGKPLDKRSDIYSLGCVIYETLTGISPFMGDTVFDTMSKHIYDAPPALQPFIPDSAVGAHLERLFMKCVAKDPADRYSSCAEIKAELQELV